MNPVAHVSLRDEHTRSHDGSLRPEPALPNLTYLRPPHLHASALSPATVTHSQHPRFRHVRMRRGRPESELRPGRPPARERQCSPHAPRIPRKHKMKRPHQAWVRSFPAARPPRVAAQCGARLRRRRCCRRRRHRCYLLLLTMTTSQSRTAYAPAGRVGAYPGALGVGELARRTWASGTSARMYSPRTNGTPSDGKWAPAC